VALVVCVAGPEPEILFIERAENERDPWSGHLGFPGGRIEAADAGPRAAAERETREELGLDLAGAEYLGRLDDLPAAHLPVVISCFVYAVATRPALTLAPGEVAGAFWFPVAALFEPERRRQTIFRIHGESHTHPALQLLGGGRPYLWGITHRLVARFLQVLGRPL
jgi:8-oxo-dGTP pyrophosphatase MutT (NUDIX family)